MRVDPSPGIDANGGGDTLDAHHVPPDHPALPYFRRRYPSRDQWVGSHLFRSGEAARRHLVRQALPDLDGLDVLDVGCGDGLFLSSVVEGRPRLLRLEDLVPKFVRSARDILSGQADRLEVGVVDSANTDNGQTFDIVLAIGVADYQGDWVRFVTRLLRRTNGRLIVDVPRKDDLLNQLRRLWLRLHGIHMQTSTRRGLNAALQPFWPAPLIQATRHSWVLCLDQP